VAIHAGMKSWIATAFGLAMTKVGRLAMTKGSGFAMTKVAVRFMERSVATRQSMSFGCHCERSVAIHAGMKSWIATAFGLAMTKVGGLAMTKGRTFLYAMPEPACWTAERSIMEVLQWTETRFC